MPERPPVPSEYVDRLAEVCDALPETHQEDAWVGVRWRIREATIVHVFGGEDQLFRIVFRAEPGEVMAFEHLGAPYFRAGWGANVVGLLIDDDTDWSEVAELVTDSYCLQAPTGLATLVQRPDPAGS